MRLIEREFVQEELPTLIEAVSVCKDLGDMIALLSKNQAQTFVDVMYEARHHRFVHTAGLTLTYSVG